MTKSLMQAHGILLDLEEGKRFYKGVEGNLIQIKECLEQKKKKLEI